jgi:hypothetical protein
VVSSSCDEALWLPRSLRSVAGALQTGRKKRPGHFGRDDMPGVRFGRNAYSEKWAPQGLFFQLVSPLSRLCRTLLQAMASVILNHPLPGSGSRL